MKKEVVSLAFVSALLLSTILQTQFISLVFAETKTENYVRVPFHGQITGIYCGPASLEMVFDYYGEVKHPLSQVEIAEVARTLEHGGTSFDDMIRAGHFSNLSTSSGTAMPENITGYSTRQLGYGAFQQFNMAIEDLKTLIDNGYPVIVAMRFAQGSIVGHYRVVVGYNPSYILYHDPYSEPNRTMTYSSFLNLWEWSSCWGLFVSPWNITLDAPAYVQQSSTFTVTADITYPCPKPFSVSDYPSSSSNATIMLPSGLSLAQGETAKKTLDAGNLSAGSSTNMSWTVKADSPGAYTISVEAEGKVAGSTFPDHSYEDRIGGSGNISITAYPTGVVIADLARRMAWPEHHNFVISKDGDPAAKDGHGTPGYQTLYGLVINRGDATIHTGTHRVIWVITDASGLHVFTFETVGTLNLAPGEITVLTHDIPASDLIPGKYYVETTCYYYAIKGEKVKTFSFTVIP